MKKNKKKKDIMVFKMNIRGLLADEDQIIKIKRCKKCNKILKRSEKETCTSCKTKKGFYENYREEYNGYNF